MCTFIFARELFISAQSKCGRMCQMQIFIYLICIYRGYYMPARGYEFYLRVVNAISHE